MTFQFSNEPNIIKIFNFLSSTNEFIGVSDAYIAPGTGLPAFSTDRQPPEVGENEVAVFNGEDWQVVVDHRGRTAYCIATAQASIVEALGDLPEAYTFKAPTSDFDDWNGHEWIKNEQKEKVFLVTVAENEKNQCINEALSSINILNLAVKNDIATDDEKALLTQLEVYLVLLSRVDISKAPLIDWPEYPPTK